MSNLLSTASNIIEEFGKKAMNFVVEEKKGLVAGAILGSLGVMTVKNKEICDIHGEYAKIYQNDTKNEYELLKQYRSSDEEEMTIV